ncbi:hypothetical protein EDF46_1597 [Frondihabitans sp. PhB188]|uniref:hypothetical protein n=1 Tax=Frondihabitans sp. PhB188 TaxID=2485200 RepID=UPI000F46CAE9|nr:hypothetical protein [Frondihabitans sp. PhB188]ROQ39962.1 hypothetical protein EDF46_1597 [Frondihabitans sp. PhB188]
MKPSSRRRRGTIAATSALSLGALLAAGLQTAAFAESPATSQSQSRASTITDNPLVFRWSDGGGGYRFGGFSVDGTGSLTSSNAGATSFAAAAPEASTLSFTLGGVQQIRDADDNTCLALSPGWGSRGDWSVGMTQCTGEGDQDWAVLDDGSIIHAQTASYLKPEVAGSTATLTARFDPAAPALLSAPEGIGEGEFAVHADITPKQVTFFGTAHPDSYVTVSGDVNGEGAVFASRRADPDGIWSVSIPTSILDRFPDIILTGLSSFLGQDVEFETPIDAKNVVTIDPIEGTVASDALTLSGAAQAGATVVVKKGETVIGSAIAEPSSTRAASDAGTYSIPVRGLTTGQHTLTVEQAQRDAPTVVTRDTIAVDVTADAATGDTSPAVFRYAGLPGKVFNAGFTVTNDGHLVSSNGKEQSSDEAGVGAVPLIVKRGADVPITDASGELCLTDAKPDVRDRRLTLEDCDNARDQKWFVAAGGEIRNPASRQNVSLAPSSTEGRLDLVSVLGSSIAKFTAPSDVGSVPFSLDVAIDGDDLEVWGTGADGRVVEVVADVTFGSKPLVIYAGDVDTTGTWKARVPASALQRYLKVPFVATQKLFGNEQSIEIDVDAKNVVTIDGLDDGDEIVGDSTELRGSALRDTTVVVKEGDEVLGETMAKASKRGAGDEGTYAVPLADLTPGEHTFTVEQSQNAHVTTRSRVTVDVVPTADAPFAVTSHSDGDTYVDGISTFAGTGTDGATVTATNQWGTLMGRATVKDGAWTFARNLGPTTTGYDITFTQTSPAGSSSSTVHLDYAGSRPLVVSSPADGSTYDVGVAEFRGTATAGARITAVNQWGTPMGSHTADSKGDWTFSRNLGPTTAGYDITVTATKGADVKTTVIHLKSKEANVPVAVTSIPDGATYRPGLNVLRGTGTPGAGITAVNATNGWNVPMGSAKVTADGTWALPERNWGPSNDYQVTVTQTNPDKTTSTTTIGIKAPVFTPLQVSGVALGAAQGAGVHATFRGTATPFATIAVTSATTATTYQSVTADAKGEWTATRVWNPEHTYTLSFDQTARDGKTSSVAYGKWTPKDSK